MPRVVEDYLGARIIPTEGFRPGREKEVVLSIVPKAEALTTKKAKLII